MREPYVATVKTLCPICGCTYQRAVTARELIAGGYKPAVCEYCSEKDDDTSE